MIRFKKYNNSHFELLNYKLEEEQAKFSSGIDYCINERKDLENPYRQIVVIIYEHAPVGFFVLDFGDEKLKLTENTSAVLLRSLSINPSYQGLGIGRISMSYISEYIKINFPGLSEIVLSVNLKNERAYNIYVKSGFVDSGRIISGEAGLQSILSKKMY